MAEEQRDAACAGAEVQDAQFVGQVGRITYEFSKMCYGGCCVLSVMAMSFWRLRVQRAISHRGMSTPGLHFISRSPKYSVPSRYCSGLPLTLSLTSWPSSAPLASASPRARRAFATFSTCSRSHRSSFCAVCKSRQGARRAGRNGSIVRALRSSAVGTRGMSLATPWSRAGEGYR